MKQAIGFSASIAVFVMSLVSSTVARAASEAAAADERAWFFGAFGFWWLLAVACSVLALYQAWQFFKWMEAQPAGTPRMIEARKLKPQEPGEEMFERMPGGLAVLAEPELFPQLRSKVPGDPMKLWNTWPGEESVEELLAALK